MEELQGDSEMPSTPQKIPLRTRRGSIQQTDDLKYQTPKSRRGRDKDSEMLTPPRVRPFTLANPRSNVTRESDPLALNVPSKILGSPGKRKTQPEESVELRADEPHTRPSSSKKQLTTQQQILRQFENMNDEEKVRLMEKLQLLPGSQRSAPTAETKASDAAFTLEDPSSSRIIEETKKETAKLSQELETTREEAQNMGKVLKGLAEQKQQLEQDLADLEQNLADLLQKKNEGIALMNRQAQEEYELLKEELQRERAEKFAALASEKARVKEFEDKLKESETALNAATTEAERIRQKFRKASAKWTQTKNQYEASKTELTQTIKNLTDQYEASRQTINNFTAQSEKRNKEFERAKQAHEELVAKLQQDLRELNEKLRKAEEERQRAQTDGDGERERQNNQIKSLHEELAATKKKIVDDENKYAKIQEQVDECQKTARDRSNRIKEQAEKLKKQTQQLFEAASRETEHKRQIREAAGEIQRLNGEIETLNGQIKGLLTRNNTLGQENKQLLTQIDGLTKAKDDLLRSNGELQDQIGNLTMAAQNPPTISMDTKSDAGPQQRITAETITSIHRFIVSLELDKWKLPEENWEADAVSAIKIALDGNKPVMISRDQLNAILLDIHFVKYRMFNQHNREVADFENRLSDLSRDKQTKEAELNSALDQVRMQVIKDAGIIRKMASSLGITTEKEEPSDEDPKPEDYIRWLVVIEDRWNSLYSKYEKLMSDTDGSKLTSFETSNVNIDPNDILARLLYKPWIDSEWYRNTIQDKIQKPITLYVFRLLQMVDSNKSTPAAKLPPDEQLRENRNSVIRNANNSELKYWQMLIQMCQEKFWAIVLTDYLGERHFHPKFPLLDQVLYVIKNDSNASIHIKGFIEMYMDCLQRAKGSAFKYTVDGAIQQACRYIAYMAHQRLLSAFNENETNPLKRNIQRDYQKIDSSLKRRFEEVNPASTDTKAYFRLSVLRRFAMRYDLALPAMNDIIFQAEQLKY